MAMFGGKKSGMKRWVASKRAVLAQIPRPTDYPQVHSDGLDADRVLLFGTGLAVGWGTTSHSEALPGALASALTELTTRGTDVDVLSQPELTIDRAGAALASAKLWRFDVVIVSVGLCDALLLTDVERWRTELIGLLELIRRGAGAATRVVVLGIEPVGSIAAYDGPNAVIADEHAVALDAVSCEVCADLPRVAFRALESDPTDYRALAVELADGIIDDLNAARDASSGAPRGPAGQDAADRERERQSGVDAVTIVDTPDEDRFDRIVTMARQIYGTSGAAFSVVDHDRVWHKSRAGDIPREVPKDASFCSTTILGRGPNVVPDMRLDTRIVIDPTIAEELGVRFYAGFPVESPSGEQIGALCVFDEKPRARADFDATLLRQLALLIQAELQVDAFGAR